MKLIKLLLSISLFASLLTNSYAQVDVYQGTSFLYIQYINQPPPNDKDARVDTMNIEYKQLDTVLFEMRDVETGNSQIKYLSIANKTYGISGTDTFLMYDYSKVQDDTFTLQYNGSTNLFIIDSVKNIVLDDMKIHKQWFLRNIAEPIQLLWVEDIGEYTYGWNYLDYLTPGVGGSVKAICNAQQLIFWNLTFNGFEPKNQSPNCNLTSLQQMVSAPKRKESIKQLVSLKPNPTAGVLYFESENIEELSYVIFSQNGSKIQEGKLTSVLDISHVAKGFYLVSIIDSDYTWSTFRIVKE